MSTSCGYSAGSNLKENLTLRRLLSVISGPDLGQVVNLSHISLEASGT